MYSKLTLLTTFVLFAYANLYAQNKVKKASENNYGYIRMGAGYNMPVSGQSTGYSDVPYSGTITYGLSGPLAFNVQRASFTAGTVGNIAVGAVFKKNIGFEVNTIFNISGTKYTGNLERNGNGYTSKERYHYKKNNNLFINPNIILETGNNVKAYLRTGVVLPVLSRMENDFYYDEIDSGIQRIIYGSEKIRHSFNIGFAGAAGLKIKLTKEVMFLLEANYTSLSLNTKSVELTSLFYNNRNVFSYVSNTSQRYSSNSKNSGNSYPAATHPYSSVGLHVGLEFSF
ncbi:hypothetical protein CAP35_03040 [Chitinophagaceae bacterium IBVUCB1]|nr:hypothetical protein CAP35_03040 [Chitinophagaceae bacterium IBVUCB1]